MSDLLALTRADLIACVEREIRLRIHVYPRWVAAKRMSQRKAEHEIECMKAVLTLLNREPKRD